MWYVLSVRVCVVCVECEGVCGVCVKCEGVWSVCVGGCGCEGYQLYDRFSLKIHGPVKNKN